MSDEKLHERLSDIKQLGATWIRVDFSWHAVQPTPQDYDWSLYDRIVRMAEAYDLKILALLNHTAPWARDARCQALATSEEMAQRCSPSSPEAFGRFAGAVAQRYGHTCVRGWEIWNEPNLSAYWKTPQGDGRLAVDPLAYARSANAAATNIRYYSSDSAIITGGLAPLFEPRYPRGVRQSDFLAQVLPHLRAELFTGVGIHPYSWPVLPAKAESYNAFYTVDNGKPQYNLRSVLQAAGWGDKQIWATEYGASTKGLRKAVGRPNRDFRPDHISEDQQAQMISQGMDEWFDKPNVGPLILHSDSDQWLTDRKNEGGFGLRRSDGSKKPAYQALQAAMQRLQAQAKTP